MFMWDNNMRGKIAIEQPASLPSQILSAEVKKEPRLGNNNMAASITSNGDINPASFIIKNPGHPKQSFVGYLPD